MANEKSPNVTFPAASTTGRQASPPGQQPRQRPLTRAVTSVDMAAPPKRRGSSMYSDNLSEVRRSFRDSTDDLLFPRFNNGEGMDSHDDTSHWHSLPLGLAIFPAIAGLFFQNGSALITDLSLLALAAIFLNWTVRAPWAWYRSAQAVGNDDPLSPPILEAIEEETADETSFEDAASSPEDTSPSKSKSTNSKGKTASGDRISARQELQIHELMGLAACFLMPAMGAWLLHTIRSQLSRPSEGLISNYNLTVFLLAAEIRPVSHVMKMVQARTLYLQRVVNAESSGEGTENDKTQMSDVTKRVEELEMHLAGAIESAHKGANGNTEQVVAKSTAQATSELRKGIQPELDALNRAVRRYEKRTTISAIQTEARLQDLEARLKDVVVLAAAAQRNVENQPNHFIVILLNWLCAAFVVPAQYFWFLCTLPANAVQVLLASGSRLFRFKQAKASKDQRSGRQGTVPRARDRKVKLLS